jgi:hypothetical protein
MDDLNTVLEEVTRAVWGTTLGLPLVRVEGEPVPAWREPPMVASVDIEGDWNGTVTLACSPRLARQAALRMFGERAGEPTTDDVQDALGELANMTSGNLKSCLGARCRLSLPRAGAALKAPEPQERRRSFTCEGEAVLVIVREAP